MSHQADKEARASWKSRAASISIALSALLGIFAIAWGTLNLSSPSGAEAPRPETFFDAQDQDTYQGPSVKDLEAQALTDQEGPLIAIPSLEISSSLIATGAQDGYLVLPDPPLATWYEKTVEIGSTKGRSLIASHVDFGHGDAAPFSQLHRIEKGTPIVVRDFQGKTHRYKANSIEIYERRALPDDLFRSTGEHQLVLVTCSGKSIDSGEAAYYPYNLVVIAERV